MAFLRQIDAVPPRSAQPPADRSRLHRGRIPIHDPPDQSTAPLRADVRSPLAVRIGHGLPESLPDRRPGMHHRARHPLERLPLLPVQRLGRDRVRLVRLPGSGRRQRNALRLHGVSVLVDDDAPHPGRDAQTPDRPGIHLRHHSVDGRRHVCRIHRRQHRQRRVKGERGSERVPGPTGRHQTLHGLPEG